jgi:hypothetical protein
VRRQADRYAIKLPVEIFAEGRSHHVEILDVSRAGMFVCLPAPLAVGTKLLVAMAFEGRRRVTAATVAHVRSELDAAFLGRSPGVGIVFRDPIEATDHLFAIGVDRLVRQWRSSAAPPAPVILRGSLPDIGLGALLTLLEHERKTGRLELTSKHTATIDVVDGKIVAASSSEPCADLRATLHALLDWTHGTFSLSMMAIPHDDISRAIPIAYVLLEHARLIDEARAAS